MSPHYLGPPEDPDGDLVLGALLGCVLVAFVLMFFR